METNFNLGSLKVVKNFILEYLNKSLLEIDAVVNNISTANEIGDFGSIDLLDKTQKTLEIVGLKGISKILNVCKDANMYVKNGLSSKEESIIILAKTSELINNTIIYIGKIIDSGFDQPTKFFNEYKELCLLINATPNIKDLFFPKLDFKESFNYKIKNDLRYGVVITENNKKYLKEQLQISEKIFDENIGKIIENFSKTDQNSLVETSLSCKLLYEELGLLQKIKLNKNIYIYLALAKIYVCGLSPKVNSLSKEYLLENKNVASKLLLEFKDAIKSIKKEIESYDLGSRTNALSLSEDKIKNLLVELKILIESNEQMKLMPFYEDVNSFFDFEYYFSQLKETLSFSDFNIFENDAIEKVEVLFSELKDGFENIVKNKESLSEQSVINFVDKNNELTQHVKSVSSIQKLSLAIEQLMMKIKKEMMIKDGDIKEISSSLVMIDYGIDKFIKNLLDDRLEKDYAEQVALQINKIDALINGKEIDDQENISLSFYNEENNALMAIFSESNIELIKIEETLDYFLKNNGENRDELINIKKPLLELKGLFSAINKQSLEEIIEVILSPWDKLIENSDSAFSHDDLRESIELLGGISLLVKSYAEGNVSDADDLYQVIVNGFHKKHFNENQHKISIEEEMEMSDSLQDDEHKNQELSEDNMNEENIVENFGDGDWPLLKELETSRFSIKNKKKKTEEEFQPKDEGYVENLDNSTFNSLGSKEDSGVDIIESLEKEQTNQEINNEESYSENIITEDEGYVENSDNSTFNLLDSKEDSGVDIIESLEKEQTNQEINNEESYSENIITEDENNEFDFYWLTESTNDPELAEIFLMEADEVIQNLNKEFEVLSSNFEEKESITNIRRFFHTLKGSGRMVGLNYVGEAAWMIEQTLNRCLANEIEFNLEIYEVSQYVKDKFIDWIGDLQISNVVNVDLLEIKNKVKLVNPELKNSFDIEEELSKNKKHGDETIELVEEDVVAEPKVEDSNEIVILAEDAEQIENLNLQKNSLDDTELKIETFQNVEIKEEVISESKVEESIEEVELIEENIQQENINDIEDFIIIDDVKIPKEVYDLFNEESDIYINGMSNIINLEYDEPIILSEQFMRDAHTLSSISAAVNLNKISKISAALEKIALLSYDGGIALSQLQINTIRHAIENLSVFKNENVLENLAFYESIKNNLDELYNRISSPIIEDNQIEEVNQDEERKMVNMDEIKEGILIEIKEILKNKESEIEGILEVIKDRNNEVEMLKDKVNSLEEEINSMKELQERKDQMFIKALEVNRNDIKVLVDLIKKMK